MSKKTKPLMPSETLTPEFVREAVKQLKKVARKPDADGFYHFPIGKPVSVCSGTKWGDTITVPVSALLPDWDEDDE